jgi:hypothetical protein
MDQISQARRRELSGKTAEPTPRYITVNAAMARYGCGRQKLYDDIGTGFVVAVKHAKRTLIDVAATDANYAALPSATTTIRPSARFQQRAAKAAAQSA